MAIQANVHEAKTRFSELLERVQKGEEVVIARAGKPCARLVPIYPEAARSPGAFRDRISGDPLGGVGPDSESWG